MDVTRAEIAAYSSATTFAHTSSSGASTTIQSTNALSLGEVVEYPTYSYSVQLCPAAVE